MQRYLKVFLIGSLFGIVSELVYRGSQHRCVKNFRSSCLMSATVGNLYGYGAVVATLCLDQWSRWGRPSWSWPLLLLGVVAAISGLECAGGLVSYQVHGYRTWNYEDHMMPVCYGYVSGLSTLYFVVMLVAYAALLYPHL